MRSKFVQYYVEGEDEEKVIHVLKTDLEAIRPGKVQKLNVVEKLLPNARLMTFRPGTMVVLVFDTDTGHTDILRRNLEKLENCSAVSEIVTIPQVLKLEHELMHSCNIKKITELLNSRSEKEFKTDLIRSKNLAEKLKEHQFDISRLWCKQPPSLYQGIVKNQAEKIKI